MPVYKILANIAVYVKASNPENAKNKVLNNVDFGNLNGDIQETKVIKDYEFHSIRSVEEEGK